MKEQNMNLTVSIIGCDGLDGEVGLGHFKWQYRRPHSKAKGGIYTYSTDSLQTVKKFCKEFDLPIPAMCGESYERLIEQLTA